MDTINKGILTELKCEEDFVKLGYAISKPLQPCRYDYVVDINGTFIRIQCKTARDNENGSILFCCRSSRNARSNKPIEHRRYTAEEIDYFYTSWNDIGYLVPVNECSTDKRLRFEPPKNGQIKGISFAEDYTIQKILERDIL